ncbi:MAK10-like protein [Tanacetum coccineum]
MGDENPIGTLGDYSKLGHEGYRDTISSPENKERMRNQASNWLERLPAGFISTWEDLTTRFLAQIFPPGRTAKLRNDILIRTIDQSASGKHRDLNPKESWAILKDLSLYDNQSWNNPRDFVKPVKAIALPQDVPSTFDRHLTELENQVQRLMEDHLALTQPTQVNKITTLCDICSGPHDTRHCMENPEQAFVEYASARTDKAGEVKTEPPHPEEPEPTLEDEFQDLHLNLPVLEVLAHAPIYNAILDKYVDSLKLCKNGSAFVQGETPAKMGDPGLFTLPCRLGGSKPFDTLADLGSCLNIILLYFFKKLNIRLLEETDHIFGLADETKSYPSESLKT